MQAVYIAKSSVQRCLQEGELDLELKHKISPEIAAAGLLGPDLVYKGHYEIET